MTDDKTLRFRVTGDKDDVLEWMDELEEQMENGGWFMNFREQGKYGKQGFYKCSLGFTTDPKSKEHFNDNNDLDNY